MLSKANGNEVIDKFEKIKRLDEAAKYYGLFINSFTIHIIAVSTHIASTINAIVTIVFIFLFLISIY